MSVGSFSASLSGLNANSQKLQVIGNNLANVNTVGFKASTVSFADLVSQSVGGSSVNPMQIGLGVTTGSITPNFTQGGIESNGISTNAAIQGNGFFIVGNSVERVYTRAGVFGFNEDGVLVTPDGLAVQGYTTVNPATGLIDTTSQPTDIVIPPGALRAPVPTSLLAIHSNLDASSPVTTTFSASAQIFDSLGVPHVATVNYAKTGAGVWTYDITVPGAEITGGTAGTPFSIGTGTVEFDANGRLFQVNGGAAADVTITGPAWASGATSTDITWDLVDANNVGTITGFSAPSATSATIQNGAATGAVASLISVNHDGELLAAYGLGQTMVVGVLALASFTNPAGLVKAGANMYSESEASGIPSTGTAGTGGRGTLIGGALEQSNVDIATEFTQMILAQRGYQANSKSITVADELLLETLNLKR
jgi:flagellar hook protein FlgE